jgi:hypothetical protein
MIDKKALQVMMLLRHKQLTRAEIAKALCLDMAAASDIIELLHTRLQYIKLSIVNNNDLCPNEPPVPKYSLTLAGRTYLLSVNQRSSSRLMLAVTTLLVAGSTFTICRYMRKLLLDVRCKFK